MTDTIRTLIYAAAAAIALLIAWLARPAAFDRSQVLDDSGDRFFAQFDPLHAKSLEIVTLDPESSTRRAFKVAEVNGVWSIPSHENYPADAQDRLARAAASVMDLIKGPRVSDSPADHEIFGVVDPAMAGESVTPGAVGTRVTLKDANDQTLVDFIIGKTVKDAPQLRYVRVPGRDRVYTAEVTTDQLSTRFEDWIERDLLKLEPFRIKQIVIDDYSIDELNQRLIRGDGAVVDRDQTANTWALEGLASGETLRTEKLDAMRTALDDLKIVDVHRKPEGLSQQLQGEGEMRLNSEAVASLMSRGYYIVGNQLLSNEGELLVKTDEGVVYSLRFGEVTSFEAGTTQPADAANEASLADSSTQPGRYLFVTAEFDASLIEQPEYEPVPELPTTMPASTAPEAERETDQTQPETPQPATQPAVDPALEQARNAAIANNDRKKTEYEKKIADGKQKVSDLNKRFADWYYVVSDGEYQKLRLRRSDLVAAATTPVTTAPAESQPPASPPLEPDNAGE